MTHLLVSVRDAAEARIACEAGTSIIDVKEPSRGSLGKADWSTIDDVVQAIGRFVPVSIALGELRDFDHQDNAAASRFEGISFAKLGLSRSISADWRTLWSDAMESVPDHTRRVAVAYADWQDAEAPAPYDVIEFAVQMGCSAVLIDTFKKTNGGLLDLYAESAVAELIERIHDGGMTSALAGSLTIEMITRLTPMNPDIIAVRRAACKRDRTSRIDSEKVRAICRAVAKTPKSPIFRP